MKNILITGGAGFIGSNLTKKLVSLGYNIVILDCFLPQIHGENYHESYTYKQVKNIATIIKGSVLSKEDWIKATKGIDAIIHLAAETGTGQSMYNISQYCNSNIIGTSLMWDVIAQQENRTIKKVIIASSRAIYGEGKYHCKDHGTIYPDMRNDKDLSKGDYNVKCHLCNQNAKALATTEDSLIHAASVYGFTKAAQEELCMITGKSINIPVASLRYQNVYGPGQSLKNPYTGILSIFSNLIRNKQAINIFEDGMESRDFIYIDDVVNATTLALQNNKANFQSFNVGSGKRTTVLQVANSLMKALNIETEINITGQYRISDIRENFADLTKIESLLGFKPKVEFQKGITSFINWVKEQEIEEDNYEQSLLEMKNAGLFKDIKS